MIKNRNIALDAAIDPSKILGAWFLGAGKIRYVAPSTSYLYNYLSGKVSTGDLYSTVALANTAITTWQNDMVVLSPDTHTLTSMLDLSKNRVHLVGADFRDGIGMWARAKLYIGSTVAATDIAVVKNTGVGNTFTSIKFYSDNDVAEGLYTFAEGGEYTVVNHCEFYKSTDLDETGAAEILNNGDSAQWLNSTIGSSANIIADDKIRANMLVTATLSGKKCRDNYIDNCLFLSKSAWVEHIDIYGANATDVERMLYVKDSLFMSNILGAATPAVAVGFGAAQTEGAVILKNCTSVDHTLMAQASVGIYVDGAVPTFATTGVAKAA